MKERPREIDIESLSTPKGDVPTIKGLETAIDSVLSEYNNLDQNIIKLHERIEKIRQEISSQSKLIKTLTESFTQLLVHLGKLDSKIEKHQYNNINSRIVESIDLLTLKKDLSRILTRIESILEEE